MSRLIDADKLIKQLDDDIKITSEFVKKSIKYDDYHDFDKSFAILYMLKSYRAIVEDMPTAFDIDKVVEKLDKQINKCNAELTPDCDTVKMFSLCGRRQAFIEAISIIKR